ncbi:MAG: hypothetical protein WCO55_01555 [Candidatus Falkowbacteria bacterium]
MDIVSHILLNNLIYNEVPLASRWWAIGFGIGPDLVGFFYMFRAKHLQRALFFNKVPHKYIPGPVFFVYKATHSLVLWMAVFSALYLLDLKWAALLWSGWAVHIVVDIFTHGAKSFPTKIFWPLSDWYFPGFAWSQKKFLYISYALFAIIYLIVYWPF